MSLSVSAFQRQGGARPPGGLKPFPPRAFSLIEVVVAVAVFAGAIVAILGLLGPTLETTREVLDSATAARLADSIDTELDRLVDVLGFDEVRDRTSGDSFIEMFGVQSGSYLIVAGPQGADKDPVTGTPKGIANGARYFRIIIRQLNAPLSEDPDSADDPNKGFLALSIRAEWPFNTPAGTEADLSERKWFSFNTAVRR